MKQFFSSINGNKKCPEFHDHPILGKKKEMKKKFIYLRCRFFFSLQTKTRKETNGCRIISIFYKRHSVSCKTIELQLPHFLFWRQIVPNNSLQTWIKFGEITIRSRSDFNLASKPKFVHKFVFHAAIFLLKKNDSEEKRKMRV